MKSLFDRIKLPGIRGNFKRADLEETDEVFSNPDRGWFQIFPFVPGEEIDWDGIRGCLVAEERLVLVILDIGKYARGTLPEDAVRQIREILNFFAEAGKDIILRGVYDREGRAMEREPYLFSGVSAHMEQLAAVAAEFGEKIFVYQGILLGNWGEMHGSRYLDDKHMLSLALLLQDHIQGSVFGAVRTPAQLHKLCPTGLPEEAAGHWGLFDDAILGSETDCGTYSAEESLRAQEVAFAKKVALSAPVGGEVVFSEGYAEGLDREEILRRLRGSHVTYLNRQHDLRALEQWKKMTFRGKGVYDRRSLYDYVGVHLGYRFLVSDVRVKVHGTGAGSRLAGKIVLQNLGFAPIYRETESRICWEDARGISGRHPLPVDLRECPLSDSGAKDFEINFEIKFEIEITQELSHPVRLSLVTRRKFDGTLIRFANRQTGDGSVLLGEW